MVATEIAYVDFFFFFKLYLFILEGKSVCVSWGRGRSSQADSHRVQNPMQASISQPRYHDLSLNRESDA